MLGRFKRLGTRQILFVKPGNLKPQHVEHMRAGKLTGRRVLVDIRIREHRPDGGEIYPEREAEGTHPYGTKLLFGRVIRHQANKRYVVLVLGGHRCDFHYVRA